MSVLRHRIVLYLTGLVLGVVFLYASKDKILHPADFAKVVYNYRLIGPSHVISPLPANLLAITLPWVEALTGLLLVLGVWRREAALMTALMLVMFLVAVGWTLAHGINLANCGCFTVQPGDEAAGRALGGRLIVQDVAMLLAALWLAWARPLPSPQAARGDAAPSR